MRTYTERLDVRDVLWSEYKSNKHPKPYEYPTEGYLTSLLYEDGDVKFFQVADFARKKRVYQFYIGEDFIKSTEDRAEADVIYAELRAEQAQREAELLEQYFRTN